MRIFLSACIDIFVTMLPVCGDGMNDRSGSGGGGGGGGSCCDGGKCRGRTVN